MGSKLAIPSFGAGNIGVDDVSIVQHKKRKIMELAIEQTQSHDQTDTTQATLAIDDIGQETEKLLAAGKELGSITLSQLNRVLPQGQVSSEQIEDMMATLSEMGIDVVDDTASDDVSESEEVKPAVKTIQKFQYSYRF